MSAFSWIRRNPLLWLGAALVVAALVLSSVFRVRETQQALVLRFNQPRIIVNAYDPRDTYGQTGAGLGVRVPFLDKIVWVDKRVLNLDLPRQSVLSTDQYRLEIEAFARYRIVNPVRMYLAAGDEAKVGERLKLILAAALRDELGKRRFAVMLSAERDVVTTNIKRALAQSAAQYGAQIVDVRIKRADLPEGPPLNSAFEQMRNSRQQLASSIIAEGNRRAQVIKDNADAAAAQIYSASFGRDPAAYDFYRAMQSYRVTFHTDDDQPRGTSTILLSPDNDYLRQFMGRKQGQ